MTEGESPQDKASHASRVGRKRPNRSLKVLPSGSGDEWPANLGELLGWYTLVVEEATKAMQMRLHDASKVIEDYRHNKTTFEEAAKAVHDYHGRWGDAFPREELRDEAMTEGRGGTGRSF